MSKIQAHRGASKERPENTLAAFKRAIELNADGIELDVHLLKDGTLAVHHDGNLGRCEEPLNSIYDYDSQSIKSFSVGNKFDKRFKEERIPLLEEVLELLSGSTVLLNVEIKSENGFITDIQDRVVKLLNKYNMSMRSIISSFNHFILADIKDKYPEYKVGILYGVPYYRDIISYCRKFNFDAVHPHFGGIDEKFVSDCHKNGIMVNAWTVDTPLDIARISAYGVDYIITNDVAAAKDTINKIGEY